MDQDRDENERPLAFRPTVSVNLYRLNSEENLKTARDIKSTNFAETYRASVSARSGDLRRAHGGRFPAGCPTVFAVFPRQMQRIR
jgi:hypothetical protein